MNEINILKEQNDKPTQKGTFKRYMFLGFLLLIGSLLYWLHYNPLQSDDEMIAHFHEHRAEIEELVKRYRDWKPSKETLIWEKIPGNKPLMEKAKVKRVDGEAPTWPLNPYSQKAMKEFSDAQLAGKIPTLNPYNSIKVELVDEDDPQRRFGIVVTSSGVHLIFKDLVFMPEIARIEGENLWLHVHPLTGDSGKLRIFPSLDSYPSSWIRGECVYRQFEPHWFIRLCSGAV